jgi:thioredoxin reductase (NADPH)
MPQKETLIIIGSGPAGLTAALYAGRANLNPLVLTGQSVGGQIATTTEVENYPGFPGEITGPELAELFRKQAERFGARLEWDEVQKVDFGRRPLWVETYGDEYEADAVIIATGASPRKLGIPGEAKFTGRGVSYCATCDGFFYTGKEVAVVGGGDSAIQEALFLTKFASTVTIIHRRGELRAGPALANRAFRNEKIKFLWDTIVTEVVGDGSVSSLRLRNVRTGEQSAKAIDGVFVYVGHYPNTAIFQGQVEMDEQGYVQIDQNHMTSVPGVFAAGEVHDHLFRQMIVSAGFGSAAAIAVERYLSALE